MYLRELHNTVIKTYKEIDSHIVIPRPKKTPYNSINDSYMISSNFIPPSVEIEMNKNSHAYTHYNYTITFGKSKCNLSIVPLMEMLFIIGWSYSFVISLLVFES